MQDSQQFGPAYDLNGATLQRFRSRARRGLSKLSREDRRAYGEAVERAVLAAQRSQLKTYSEPERRPSCASRTWHTTGEEIDAAIRAQHRAALAACPSQIRRARSPDEWQRLYDEAMQAKRDRRSAIAKRATRRNGK